MDLVVELVGRESVVNGATLLVNSGFTRFLWCKVFIQSKIMLE